MKGGCGAAGRGDGGEGKKECQVADMTETQRYVMSSCQWMEQDQHKVRGGSLGWMVGVDGWGEGIHS